jgi:16S rRNA (cytosine1407-C5)-methyltransferase
MSRKTRNLPITDAFERLTPLLSAEELPLLLAELQKPLSQALRVNPLKADPQTDIHAWAEQYGWRLEAVPYCPTGWWVPEAQTPISQTLEHRLGKYYIQDAASMLPVELFDFPAGEEPLILDLAASPGGKTTHLISRSGDRGLVLANDSSQERITALRLVLQTWGAAHTAVTHFPGEKFGLWYPETFDRVLLDAPCSMQGLRSTDSHPMRPITDRERDSLAERQARLLASAFQALKVGGQAVYSTCTLTPEEDEGVVEALLRRYPGAVRVEDSAVRLPVPAPGLSRDGERVFDPEVQKAVRLWPHRYHTSGFFAALITKTAPVPAQTQTAPARSMEKAGFQALSRRAATELDQIFLETYGFPLLDLVEKSDLELWGRGDQVYAFPLSYIRHFASLPCQSAGLPVGENAPDGFSPAHEWVTRHAPQFRTGRLVLDEAQAAAWLRGEDIHGEKTGDARVGTVVIVCDEQGRFLGRGKQLSGRLKNLLPKRMLS